MSGMVSEFFIIIFRLEAQAPFRPHSNLSFCLPDSNLNPRNILSGTTSTKGYCLFQEFLFSLKYPFDPISVKAIRVLKIN
jgi:hypothetical protein